MTPAREALVRAVRATVESLELRYLLTTIESRQFVYNGVDQHIDVKLSDATAESWLASQPFKLVQLTHDSPQAPGADPLTPVSLNGSVADGGSTARFTLPPPSKRLDDGWYQTYVEDDSPTADEAKETFSFIAGDLDSDGGVSINDYNQFIFNFGHPTSSATYAMGDFDYDGSISIMDFNILAANFGQRLPDLPTQAGSVVVANTTADALDVGWNAGGDPAGRDGFKIYRSVDGTNFELVGTTNDRVDEATQMNPI